MQAHGERVFLTVEPILSGCMSLLAHWCFMIRPEFVNIGADSKGHGLPEPSAAEVRLLIAELGKLGVPIREKRNLGRLLGMQEKDSRLPTPDAGAGSGGE
jgi:hypothetical protein